jgi:hypothetical protein
MLLSERYLQNRNNSFLSAHEKRIYVWATWRCEYLLTRMVEWLMNNELGKDMEGSGYYRIEVEP